MSKDLGNVRNDRADLMEAIALEDDPGLNSR